MASGDRLKLITALTNPKSQNPRQRKTGLQQPPSTSTKSLKPADRRKTYLITSPDSVSILSSREEVPHAHRIEVESRAPASTTTKVNLIPYLAFHMERVRLYTFKTTGMY